MLDPHHIISQGHAKKTNQKHLISNQGNVVMICRDCHNQTTASMVRKRLEKEESKAKPRAKSKRKAKAKRLCSRCGRDSHTVSKCYAKTTTDGVSLKPSKAKAKSKSKRKAKPKTKSQKKISKAKKIAKAIEKFGKELRDVL